MTDAASIQAKLLELDTAFDALQACLQTETPIHTAALDLNHAAHQKLEGALNELNAITKDKCVLKQFNHDVLLDLLSMINSNSCKINSHSKRNLNLLSQHSATRTQLLAIIDKIIQFNLESTEREAPPEHYNTDYENLAKEIRQVIRSTPILDDLLAVSSD